MRKMLQICSVLMLGLLFLAGNAWAQTHYHVNGSSATPDPSCQVQANPCTTISAVLALNPPSNSIINVYGDVLETAPIKFATPNVQVVGHPAGAGGPLPVIRRNNISGLDSQIFYVAASNVAFQSVNFIGTQSGAGVYGNGRLGVVSVDIATATPHPNNITDVTFDNVTFGDSLATTASNSNTLRSAVQINAANNVTIRNSRFHGFYSYAAVEVQFGTGHVIENNFFNESYIGTMDSTPGGRNFINGRGGSVILSTETPVPPVTAISPAVSFGNVDIRFNRFSPKVLTSGGAGDGDFSAIYIQADRDASIFTGVVTIEHNTIALPASTYPADVDGVYFGGTNGADFLANLAADKYVFQNNVIRGAKDTGFYLAHTYGPIFGRNNLYYGNGVNSNNSIDEAVGGNIVNQDPLFDGTDEFGYGVGSPALGASSSFVADPLTSTAPNIGYNQELNTSAPTIANFAAAGSDPNTTGDFLANEDIVFTWEFDDPDSPQDDEQTNFTLSITDATNTYTYTYDGVVDGASADSGKVLQHIMPGGSLPVGANSYTATLTVYDAIGLTAVETLTFDTQANNAPTAHTFMVDSIAANTTVNNTNPQFSFVYEDLDGDELDFVRISVYRITDNCGINCAPLSPTASLLPNHGTSVAATNSILIADRLLSRSAYTFLQNVASGDTVAINFFDITPIIGPVEPNETYEFTVQVADAAGSGSSQAQTYGLGALNPDYVNADMFFTSVDATIASVANFSADGKDNSVVRIVDGTVAQDSPTFTWNYNGFDEMLSFDFRITSTGLNPDPENPVYNTTIVTLTGQAASVATLLDAATKEYEFRPTGLANVLPNRLYKAEVRVYNQSGQPSAWEEIVFVRNQAPTFQDIPGVAFADDADLAAGPVATANGIAPVISWTFSDPNFTLAPDDEEQTAFQVVLYSDNALTTEVYNSGKIASADTSHQVADLELLYDTPYHVVITTYDGLDVVSNTYTGEFRTPQNTAPVVTIDDVTGTDVQTISGTNYIVSPTDIHVTFTYADNLEGRDLATYRAEFRTSTGTLIGTTGEYTPTTTVASGDDYTFELVFADFDALPTLGDAYQLVIVVTDTGATSADAFGEGESAPYVFEYVTVPSAPAISILAADLRAGGDVNTLTPTFEITANDVDGNENASYTIEIKDASSTTVYGPTIVTGALTLGTAVNYTVSSDLAVGDYTVEVYTSDIYGDGAVETLAFTVNPIPATPSNVQVFVNAATDDQLNLANGPTFTVTWDDEDHGENAAFYRVRVMDPNETPSVEMVNTGKQAVSTPGSLTFDASNLEPGKTYRLRLIVGDTASDGVTPQFGEFSDAAVVDFRISDKPVPTDLLVDGVANNPNVENLFPEFSWTFGDPDETNYGDTQSAFEIVVTRTTNNAASSHAAPYVVWTSGKIATSNEFVNYGDITPIIEGVKPNESYSWTLVVYDNNDVPSDAATGTFTTANEMQTDLALEINGEEYEAGGTPSNRFNAVALNVIDGTPEFAWVASGLTQSWYDIEVNTSSTFAAADQVWFTGQIASTDNPVTYAGPALVTGTTYYVRVKVGSGVASAGYAYAKFVLNEIPNNASDFAADGTTMNDDINTPTAVDTRTPVLSWTFSDPNTTNATDSQSAFVIELSTTMPFTTPFATFDSDVDLTIDGTLSSFQIPANVLKFDTEYAARIKVRDVHGAESTDWIYGTFETAANTAPTTDDLIALNGTEEADPTRVLTLTPNFQWTFEDADGDDQGFYELIIEDASNNVVYETGYVSSAVLEHIYDAANELTALQWGATYTATLNAWDAASDPVNFTGAPDGTGNDDVTEFVTTTTLTFTLSAFNLTPVSLTATPPSIHSSQSSTLTAELSTPRAWATFVISNGSTDTFLASVQSDDDAEATFAVSGLAAGSYVARVYETPIELASANWATSTIGANYATANLTVTGGTVASLGDINGDNFITTLDAQLALQHETQLIELNPAQQQRGDVNGNNFVESNDAFLILAAAAASSDPADACFPVMPCYVLKVAAFEGELSYGKATRDGSDWLVPVIARGGDIVAVSLFAAQSEGVSFEVAALPQNWLSADNQINSGYKLAAAGTQPLATEVIGHFRISNGAERVNLSVSGSLNGTTVNTKVEEVVLVEVPMEFSLNQNYPNPFNPSTQISFSLPEASPVIIEVYSSVGQKVATLVNQPMNAGSHIVQFDASRLASGVYIYTLQAGKFRASHKMTLIK